MQYVIPPYAPVMDHLVWWEGGFNSQELDILQNKAKMADMNARVGNEQTGGTAPDVRRSKVSWLHNNSENNWVFQRLGDIAAKLNAQYFRFDISGFGESLQLTNYDHSDQGMYGWHYDYNTGTISRKLSLVLQLSDPSEYEGGNLQIMTEKNPGTVSKQRGLIVAFPSYLLHQVTPVTSGNRQTLVAWVSGPAFR